MPRTDGPDRGYRSRAYRDAAPPPCDPEGARPEQDETTMAQDAAYRQGQDQSPGQQQGHQQAQQQSQQQAGPPRGGAPTSVLRQQQAETPAPRQITDLASI